MLASRYGSSQEFEDLKQEALLAALEEKERFPEAGDAYLIGVMRKAMQAYYNIKLKPVTIPQSGQVYALLSAIKGEEGGEGANYTEQALMDALKGHNEPLEPQTLRQEVSTEETYQNQETVEHIRHNLWVYLTDKQALAIDYVFFKDYSPSEVAKAQDVSQQRISQWLHSGLAKLKKMLEELEK